MNIEFSSINYFYIDTKTVPSYIYKNTISNICITYVSVAIGIHLTPLLAIEWNKTEDSNYVKRNFIESRILQQADAYKKITKRIFESVIRAPLEEVIEDFRQTELYTDDFLEDLEEGPSKSSYAKIKK